MLLKLQEDLIILVVALTPQTVKRNLVVVAEILKDEELSHVFCVGQDPCKKDTRVMGSHVLLENV